MRAEACLLDLVLDGQLCMYQANGKIMMCRSDADRPAQIRLSQPCVRRRRKRPRSLGPYLGMIFEDAR
jgi:hypothetical protein